MILILLMNIENILIEKYKTLILTIPQEIDINMGILSGIYKYMTPAIISINV